MLPDLSPSEYLRYSRHLLIPEVGLEGQRKLKADSILVVGAGGLGSPVSLYLAAAGIGHIGLVDCDAVDLSNLQRQIIHETDLIGIKKVISARKRLLDLNPDIHVDIYDEPFTSANARQIAQNYEIVIDCSDNFPTRYLTNDLCVLTGKPNVYGAVYRFDGQVSVFDARQGPCYRCLFPVPPPTGSILSCSDGGVLGILPGTIGTLQASEAIKLVLGVGESLIGRLLLFNALDMSFETITLRKNPNCKICGSHPEITELIDYEEFCGAPAIEREVSTTTDWEISPLELSERFRTTKSLKLIDVREPHELKISRIEGATLIPLSQLPTRLSELDETEEIVVFCRTGSRSIHALEILRRAGFEKVKVLKGGINAWVKEIDPKLPMY